MQSAVSAYPLADTRVLQKQRIARRARSAVDKHHPSMLLPGLFLVVVLSILFYVWTRVQVVQLGYEISAGLNQKQAAIIAQNELKLEIATVSSAQRLERDATGKLGMYHPSNDQLVIIQ